MEDYKRDQASRSWDESMQAFRDRHYRRRAKARSKARRGLNERNAHGVLLWRVDRAAYLARQFSTPTIYGQSRQMRRLEKRHGEIRTVIRF